MVRWWIDKKRLDDDILRKRMMSVLWIKKDYEKAIREFEVVEELEASYRRLEFGTYKNEVMKFPKLIWEQFGTI